MTMPSERTRSLLFARELLVELANSEQSSTLPDEVRRQAQVVLRHYPSNTEIEWLARQVERECRYPLLAPDATEGDGSRALRDSHQRRESLQRAFDSANAIVDLDGPLLRSEGVELQRKVIEGELTFDQAVQELVDQATEKHASSRATIKIRP